QYIEHYRNLKKTKNEYHRKYHADISKSPSYFLAGLGVVTPPLAELLPASHMTNVIFFPLTS
ncbi:MAG: hypothetical protein II919_08850, partial [Lachnospiraceae bacterium]|nr:hypothetical protein [Lachnospiraceae bacterium]